MPITSPSPEQRLLEVASHLFYAEGIHAVGVDRVIAEAGVAKATLYAHFASKADLVAAYLERQSLAWVSAVRDRAAAHDPGTRSAVLAPFGVLDDRARTADYRGCPFINAAAEFPDPGPVATQVAAHRRRLRSTFATLAGPRGSEPELLDALVVLYDGAMSAAHLDGDPDVVSHAAAVAARLLEGQGTPRASSGGRNAAASARAVEGQGGALPED